MSDFWFCVTHKVRYYPSKDESCPECEMLTTICEYCKYTDYIDSETTICDKEGIMVHKNKKVCANFSHLNAVQNDM